LGQKMLSKRPEMETERALRAGGTEEVCEERRGEEAEETRRRGHSWKTVFHAGGGTALGGCSPRSTRAGAGTLPRE